MAISQRCRQSSKGRALRASECGGAELFDHPDRGQQDTPAAQFLDQRPREHDALRTLQRQRQQELHRGAVVRARELLLSQPLE